MADSPDGLERVLFHGSILQAQNCQVVLVTTAAAGRQVWIIDLRVWRHGDPILRQEGAYELHDPTWLERLVLARFTEAQFDALADIGLLCGDLNARWSSRQRTPVLQ